MRVDYIEALRGESEARTQTLASQLATIHLSWADDVEQLHYRFLDEIAASRLCAEDRDEAQSKEIRSLKEKNRQLSEEVTAARENSQKGVSRESPESPESFQGGPASSPTKLQASEAAAPKE